VRPYGPPRWVKFRFSAFAVNSNVATQVINVNKDHKLNLK